MSLLLALTVVLAKTTSGRASDCTVTSFGPTPINDLGAALYLGQFLGGLYPDGLNNPPPVHASEGLSRAQAIQPLDTGGNPSPTGKFVLMSIGMSNTTQEFCSAGSLLPCDSWTFMGQAGPDIRVNHSTLVIINGAMGGQAALSWDSSADANYDRVLAEHLTPNGLSEAQVQVVWVKQADIGPTISLPNLNADAYQLQTNLANIARAAKVRYPNLRIMFLSNRIYAGYATTQLNREPFAYESGFSVKWLIEAQITQMAGGSIDPRTGDLDYNSVVPWLAWGPYLWADGLIPRSDGLIWECSDLQSDGTHPAMSGEEKVGSMLLDFMLTSPFSEPWFLAKNVPGLGGDCDGDLDVDLNDFANLATCMAGPNQPAGAGCTCTDFDDDADADMIDFMYFSAAMTPPPQSLDPALDDFERPSLGDNWDIFSGPLGIVDSSDLGALGPGIGMAGWQGSAFGADQFSEGVLATGWNPADSVQLQVRFNGQTGARYGFRRFGSGGLELRYINGAANVLLASISGAAVTPGDTMRIEVVGATIRGLINGAVVLTGTDRNLTSGAAGVAVSAQGPTPAAFFESWSGGTVTPP